jgi:predicted  nucleic acid-binding Zn-ribbon protein
MAAALRELVRDQAQRGTVMVQTAAGEVLDRLSILRIKRERFMDAVRLTHVRRELATLEHAAGEWLGDTQVEDLLARLKEVNERLWDVEDALRDNEAEQDFSERFVELARSVYKINEERGALKREVNSVLKAAWSEQKQYGGAGKQGES